VNGVVAQLPIADGGRWLQGMRSANEWASFAASFDQDRRRRVLGGEGGTIAPRGELQIATRERLNTNLKSDVDSKVPERVSMESAEGLLRYRPIESADRVAGLFVIAVADDDVTPTRDAVELFDRARSPKLLLIQRNTTHYAAYAQYQRQVIPLMVAWLTGLHAGASEQRVTEAIGSVDVTNFDLRTAW
jgi:hypothetical protein